MTAAAPPRPLTERQAQIVRFIAGYVDEHAFAPTLREIADACGIRSTNAISDALLALERKGWISRSSMRARSIVLLARIEDGLIVTAPAASDRAAADAAREDVLRRIGEAQLRLGRLGREMARLAETLGALRLAAGAL